LRRLVGSVQPFIEPALNEKQLEDEGVLCKSEDAFPFDLQTSSFVMPNQSFKSTGVSNKVRLGTQAEAYFAYIPRFCHALALTAEMPPFCSIAGAFIRCQTLTRESYEFSRHHASPTIGFRTSYCVA
jgi:hypothetical protein